MSMTRQYVKVLRSFRILQVGQVHAFQRTPRLDLDTGLQFRSLNYAFFSTNREVSSWDKTEEESEKLENQSQTAAPVGDNSPATDSQPPETVVNVLPSQPSPTPINKTAARPPPANKKEHINDRLLRMSGTMGPSEYDNQVHSSFKGRANPSNQEEDDDYDGDRYERNPNRGGFRGNNNNFGRGGGGGGRQWN